MRWFEISRCDEQLWLCQKYREFGRFLLFHRQIPAYLLWLDVWFVKKRVHSIHLLSMLNWYAWEISQAEFGKGKDGRLSWTGPCPSCSRRRSPCRWGCWFQVINWKPGREEFVSSKTCRYLVLAWFLCIVCESLWDQMHLLSFNGACCNARRPGSLSKAMQLWRQSRRRWPKCVLILTTLIFSIVPDKTRSLRRT